LWKQRKGPVARLGVAKPSAAMSFHSKACMPRSFRKAAMTSRLGLGPIDLLGTTVVGMPLQEYMSLTRGRIIGQFQSLGGSATASFDTGETADGAYLHDG